MKNDERDTLIAQGWTPPVTVDPDIAEAQLFYDGFNHHLKDDLDLIFDAIKRGRALAALQSKEDIK